MKFQRIVEQDIKTELEKDVDNRQRMLPTHVIKLPDGTEVGDYIVLDFGGKFFRIGFTWHKQVGLSTDPLDRRIGESRI